jgi:hypothetical protein
MLFGVVVDGRGATVRASGLSHAVCVEEEDVHGEEVLPNSGVHGSSSIPKVQALIQTQCGLYLVEDQFLGKFELPGGGLILFLLNAPLGSVSLCPRNQIFGDAAFAVFFLLYFGVHFFPDSGDSKKELRPYFKESLHEGSLERSGFCEVDVLAFDDGREDVEVERRDVGEGEETDDSAVLTGRIEFSALLGFGSKGHVVVRQHHALRHAGSATGVAEGATLSRRDPGLLLFNSPIIDIVACGQEPFP